MTRKTTLKQNARTLRVLAVFFDHWLITLAIICVLSPISPHVRLPYEVSGAFCDYIGTSGVIAKSDNNCPPVAIINTRNGEGVSW